MGVITATLNFEILFNKVFRYDMLFKAFKRGELQLTIALPVNSLTTLVKK